MATHEQLLLQTAPRVFAHELMKKCAACGEPTEFAYVSSCVLPSLRVNIRSRTKLTFALSLCLTQHGSRLHY